VEASRFAGITRQYVRQLEAGLSDPTVGTLQKLAKALGVPVTEMLG
jgi:transcriptional regulator with XRE-family HTH domain